MYRSVLRFGLAVALITAESASSAVMQQPAPAPASGSIVMKFAPPVDQPMIFRVVEKRLRDGKQITNELTMTVTFSRNQAGYSVTAVYDLPPQLRALPKSIGARAITRPLTLYVNLDGEITAIKDEPEYWDTMVNTFDQMGPSGDAKAKQVAMNVMNSMRQLPDAERFSLIAQKVRPLWESAGTEWVVGEIMRATETAQSPLGTPVRQAIESRLISATDTEATFLSTIRYDVDDIKATLKSLTDQIDKADVRNKAEAAIAAMAQITTTTEVRAQRDTGITTYYSSVKQSGADVAQSTTLEKMR